MSPLLFTKFINSLELKFTITILLFIGGKYLYSSLANNHNFQIFEWDMRNLYPYVDNPQISEETLTLICYLPIFYSVFMFFTIVISFYCCGVDYNFNNEIINSIFFNNIFDLSFIYQCLAITMFFTQVIKTEVGMPRPNFFQMCNYQQINTNYTFYLENTSPYQIVNIDNCYTNIDEINDSISSFPSNHASYCFSLATSTFLLLSIKKLPFYNILWISPFVIASYIGISRIQDYYHNISDVIAGALLGFLISIVIFTMYKIEIINRYKDFIIFEEIVQMFSNV